MRRITVLTKDDIRSLELAYNKTICAQQALRPDAVPARAPASARDRFFREAIFACADARCLQEYFWRDLADRHGIAGKDINRLCVDFDTNELLLRD